ncbi:hypothetical protein CUJ84_Chr002257 [Rhizobium leguminosarum]|uniref:Propionate 3-nitronate monooxygenase n=1 Tax=Rhizobium leguminosarum TaxID=384 RepID=A0A2K9Z311_RHILE|nr:hypothetical protein CUJ84_Chr002257 [Rhizobium leguminosarum]
MAGLARALLSGTWPRSSGAVDGRRAGSVRFLLLRGGREFRLSVVSFHFGLPERSFVERVKATGAKILSSATTVAEAVWLEENGVDAVIAMGFEAGGHRGNFLGDDMSTQTGTMALVPQVADAVRVPVIAAGGIADGRGVAAALMLGASAVQVGTAYLLCPEARIPKMHAHALLSACDDNTAITNVFTGRPARTSSIGWSGKSGRSHHPLQPSRWPPPRWCPFVQRPKPWIRTTSPTFGPGRPRALRHGSRPTTKSRFETAMEVVGRRSGVS